MELCSRGLLDALFYSRYLGIDILGDRGDGVLASANVC